MRFSVFLSPLLLAASSLSALDWEGDLTYQWQRGFNLSFTGLGAFGPSDASNPGLRTYDDGFVGVDALGNAQDRTSYWGYTSASQTPAGAQTVVFSSASAAADAGFRADADNGRGVELAARAVFWRNDRLAVGILFGAGYGRVRDDGGFSLAGLPASTVRDAYSYSPPREDFIAVAPPGHVGSTSGLGPLLHTDFTRSTAELAGARTVDGAYSVDATNLTFSMGLAGEWQFTDRLSLRLDGGVTVAAMRADMAVSQTVKINHLTSQYDAFSTRDRSTLVGYFGRISGLFQVTDAVALRLGLRYADYGSIDASTGSFSTRLDASSLLFIEGGWSFRF